MKELRSRGWFGKTDKMGFIYRSWMKNQGFPSDLFDGRPVIGICNTWSELTPCNAHLRDIDGVVLLTGCDKTTPSTVMGAASVNLPTLVVPGGPMLNGKFQGKDIGSGT